MSIGRSGVIQSSGGQVWVRLLGGGYVIRAAGWCVCGLVGCWLFGGCGCVKSSRYTAVAC